MDYLNRGEGEDFQEAFNEKNRQGAYQENS
jgi:hypothetical protein